MANSTDQPNHEQQDTVVGTFLNQTAVESARDTLQTAGFSDSQLEIESTVVEPNQPVAQTRAREGAAGGAVAGAVFGAAAGFLLSMVAKGLPEQSIATLYLNPLMMTLAGGAIGTIAMGLLGAASGVNVPKTESSSEQDRPTDKYLLHVKGTVDEIRRAAEVLRQSGMLTQ